MSNIDLNAIANNPKLNLQISSVQEENPFDARLRRVKDIILFVMAISFITAAFAYCGYTLITASSTADDKKWVSVIAGSIISALLGYLTGKRYS
jgi:hypothetical protein